MKTFGSETELVSIQFRFTGQLITFEPNQATTYTASRSMQLPPQDASSILVSIDATQVLTNKSIDGGNNTLTNIPLSAATGVLATTNGGTGQNSSATFPTSGVVVTEAGTETLTNKTLTAPVISTIVNTGTLTLPTSTDTLVGRATTDALTNKSIDGSANTLTNIPVNSATGLLAPANGGTGVANTNNLTTGSHDISLTTSATTSLTLPATGTLATLAGAETLSNKTLTGAVVGDFEDLTEIATPATPSAGLLRIYAKSDDKLYSKNSSGVESQVGAASGTVFAQNYLLNSGFDFYQRGGSILINNGLMPYTADRWVAQNNLGSAGVITAAASSGTVDGSSKAFSLLVSTAPSSPTNSAGLIFQTMENRTSRLFYNKSASFSVQVTALGNVNQVGLLFAYATSETQVTTAIGSEVFVTINSASATLCQIINQAIGTAQTTSGVVGVRIRASGVSSGNLSDLGNGITVEQAAVTVGDPQTTWARAFPDVVAEYNACQRFFHSATAGAEDGSLPGSACPVIIMQAYSTTMAFGCYTFPVVMRIAPTTQPYGSAQLSDFSGGSVALTTLVTDTQSQKRVRVVGTVASGLVSGNATNLIFSASSDMAFDAEIY